MGSLAGVASNAALTRAGGAPERRQCRRGRGSEGSRSAFGARRLRATRVACDRRPGCARRTDGARSGAKAPLARPWRSSVVSSRHATSCLARGRRSSRCCLGSDAPDVAGMLVAALLFIGPAVLIMLGLAEVYRHVGANHEVQLVLLGVDAAVVGIVAPRGGRPLTAEPARRGRDRDRACSARGRARRGEPRSPVLAGGGVIAYGVWIVRNGISDRRRAAITLRRGRRGWPRYTCRPTTAGLLPLGL